MILCQIAHLKKFQPLQTSQFQEVLKEEDIMAENSQLWYKNKMKISNKPDQESSFSIL